MNRKAVEDQAAAAHARPMGQVMARDVLK